ncbi:hypothetical protein IAU60_006607 [Kwoniella sp. DSM 27419]
MVLYVRAVHTFMAEHGDELEFQAGEQIEVLEKDDAFGDGWWRGRNTKGEEGLFPATYISEDPNSEEAEPAKVPSRSPSPRASSVNGDDHASNNNLLAAPVVSAPEESPRGTHDAEGGILDSAVSAVEATAVSVGNVMGKTIGEIQDAIESITAKPESDDEEELGIGQDTRAKLAEQARLANEQRERTQRNSGGVAGLVYSDESDDEDEAPASPFGGKRSTPGTMNGFHESPVSPPRAVPETEPVGGISSHVIESSPAQLENSTGSLEPALNIASITHLDRPAATTRSSTASEHEITGDLLLELDANLLKELDIPQFGKRMRIAAAISELRRPTSMVSAQSQPHSPAGAPLSTPGSQSTRGISAPPSALAQPFASTTPPLSTPPTSASNDDNVPHAAWSHSRKTSNVGLGMPTPMAAINEDHAQSPAVTTKTSSTPVSMPASPVTPASSVTKRESTGSMGHKRGKPSIENKERLSFFGRTRKPAPTSVSPSTEQQRLSSRLGFPSSTRVHQMQPATPETNRRISGVTAGNAAALKQIGTPDHSGYLKKKGDRYGWKQRFFVLKGGHLYYMKSESEDRVKGHIDLRGYRVIVDENTNPGAYGFRLTGGPQTHYFSSMEQMQIREWMKALMKATIARDYSVPVTSSCNIPTIPLAEAQALAPRPPSPATREATQRASRRENPNQLTAHDASILLNIPSPARPSRDNRRPSNGGPRPSVASVYHDEGESVELVKWVNSELPSTYPRVSSLPQSFTSGEVIFLLVKHLSGVIPSPPVPPQAFAPEAGGQPGLEGLFAMMDILIDAGIDTAGVSINDVRSGDAVQISRLLKSIQGWNGARAGVAH